MKKIIGLLGLGAVILTGGGCIAPHPAGVSVGVYGEYPQTYYGHSRNYYYHRPYHREGRWHHPYDRDHYYYRSHTW